MRDNSIPFFVLGSQYHRAPVPPRDEWDHDFALMREFGFNTTKFWIIWRWVERKPGRYNWELYDELMDCARRHQIKAVPNIVLEMAPEWVYRQFPESMLVDESGRPVQDLMGQAYQLGGFCPNWDCQDAFERGLDFSRRAVERYAKHPAIFAIDIWNEPKYIPSFGPATQRRFRQWLENRFKTIDAYNEHTGQAEAEFSEIRLPSSAAQFPKSLLYHEYLMERVCQQMAARLEIVRQVNPKLHPHSHACGPGSSLLMHEADDWAQAKLCEFYGTSVHQTLNTLDHPYARTRWAEFPLALDGNRAASPYTWVSELRSGPQTIGFQGIHYKPEDLRHWIWTIAAHGIKGLLFWQFRPERVGPEAPECGLITLDGQSTPRLPEVREFASFCKEHEEFLLAAGPLNSSVGILSGFKQGVMGMLAGRTAGLPDLHQESLAGIYRSFWQASWPVEFFSIDQLIQQPAMNAPRALVVPFFTYLDPQQAEWLTRYVADGGTLISEGGLGTYDQRGWHAKTLPACGLSRVFGLRERERIATTRAEFQWEGLGSVAGRQYHRELMLEGAAPLASFADGGPAVTQHTFGRGKAIYIATHPGLDCIAEEHSPSLQFWPDLVKRFAAPPIAVKSDTGITARVLRHENKVMIFAFNRGPESGTIRIEGSFTEVQPVRAGAVYSTSPGSLSIRVPGRDVAVCAACC